MITISGPEEQDLLLNCKKEIRDFKKVMDDQVEVIIYLRHGGWYKNLVQSHPQFFTIVQCLKW